MMELLGSAFIAFIEKELIKHEPEIQQFVVDQISKLSTILADYISSKCSGEIEKLEHVDEDNKPETD